MINIINFINILQKKKKKKENAQKCISPKRKREREIINSANKSVKYPLGRKKKSKRRERKDHTDLTCYSHATLRIDYPPTNYHRCSIPVYTRGSFEDVAETGSRRTRGI